MSYISEALYIAVAAEPGAAHNQGEGGLQPPVYCVHRVPYLHIYIRTACPTQSAAHFWFKLNYLSISNLQKAIARSVFVVVLKDLHKVQSAGN